MTSSTSAPERSPSAQLADAATRLLRDHTGRGPTKARAYISDDLVTVVLQDTLTTSERTLADNGQWARVSEGRLEIQRIMGPALSGEVTRITGRDVAAFVSANHRDPDLAIETFLLADRAD